MTRAKWYLLRRRDELGMRWIYEPLRPGGLQKKLKAGWKLEK